MIPREASFRVRIASDGAGAGSAVWRHLEGAGVVVEAVPTAHAAAGLADGKLPDLLVVDGDDHQGIEICRLLKSNPQTLDVPVIVLGETTARRLECFAVGVDEFLTRDISGEEFLARVESLLRINTARRNMVSAQLAREIRHREEIRDTFRRYVSPAIADEILSHPGMRNRALATANARVRATVLFADMRGFTRISEQLAPAAVVPLLNEYFALLTEVTFKHEGTVFNMAGDCLMVGYNVPFEQPDCTERAIGTAREMLSRFRKLAAKWNREHGIETGLGIGINEGEVIAGNIGSPAYMSYTIIGDTVNVASRLAQRARAGEMLFSEEVKKSLESRGAGVGAVDLPPLSLRGRASPVSIYCIPVGERLDIRS
ncbi:MAG TPA: adenylate/guanylate cyclase domain-containing protein [Burkholderiales bacterium]|nr:adenylate/guanylate cyclase domain-containing protein [Burkholderiales bacterium]